jgi:hypothetical protein
MDTTSFRLRETGMSDESHARIPTPTPVLSAHTTEVAVPLVTYAALRLTSTASLWTSFPAYLELLISESHE